MRYPGAVQDPDTGAWISDAEVAEVTYTAFAAHHDRITARLVVRRVKDARYPDALFPVWRYHPFFTNTDLPTAQADIVHRRHAIIETVFADLIDGPWPTCRPDFRRQLRLGLAPRSRTTCSAPPAPSPADAHTVARGATLRRQLINIPARLARPARTPVLHLPIHWPWAPAWLQLWDQTIEMPQPAHRCLTSTPPTPARPAGTVPPSASSATPPRR